MSKSKGNVIDPLDMVDGITAGRSAGKTHRQHDAAADGGKNPAAYPRNSSRTASMPHGTDALQLHLAALASTGRDINWDMNARTATNFCNKLWNASRYVLMNTEDQIAGLSQGKQVRCSSGKPGGSLDPVPAVHP